MTRVYAARCGDRCQLIAWGHATGSTTVCAAISGLLFALAGYLTNAAREGRVQIAGYTAESGYVVLTFRGGEAAGAVFDMTVIGLMQIAAAHPAQIRVMPIEGRAKG